MSRRFLLPVFSLWQREIVRFVRQRSRVTGALGQPLLFWILLGSGLGSSFRAGGGSLRALAAGDAGVGFLEYAFPGTAILILLFTAIFATISIIEDRREGFLQAVLVAPAPRAAIALGKILGGTTLAVAQAILFLALAPLVGIRLTPASALAAVAVLAAVAFALTGIGFTIAWALDSTAGFHAIMNLLLMPMWILSGAFFPSAGAAAPVRWIMAANPLTYGLAAFRRALYLGEAPPGGSVPALAPALAVTLLFAAAAFAASALSVRRRAVVGS
jgi:ABC-2 type transport system permease protein